MQQIRQKQIHGLNGGSLEDDIKSINLDLQHFDAPVKTKSELPIEGNTDGDMRVVIDENKIYIWNEEQADWISQSDVYTDNASITLVLGQDGQTTLSTNIKVGVPGGMSTLSSVELFVNGMLQKPNVDYINTIDTDFNCMIEWKSRDFQLEISDTITMSYSALFLS